MATPEVVRAAAAAAEPLPAAVVALDAEHVEAATRAGDRLHRNEEPFALRLVLILQAELGTDFRGTEIEADLLRAVVDLLAGSAILETKLLDGADHKLDFALGVARHEGGLAEDVVCPVADATDLVQGFAEVVSGFEAGAELERAPGLEVGGFRFGDDHFATKEAINAFFAAELVPNRFNATEGDIRIFHGAVPIFNY